MTELVINNLTKKYGDNIVLDDLSLKLEGEGVYALVAPNGTGKTTLLDCITNLIDYQSGEIKINGVSNSDKSIFKSLSYMQDANILFPSLTGKDHLKFVINTQKLPKSRLREVVEFTKIEKYYTRAVKTYSLGMKQRLLLAIALVNKPKIILLDEPFNGLDPTSQIEVRLILKQLEKEGTLVVLSTHFLGEISQLTDKLLFLKDKKIVKKIVEDELLMYSIQTNDNKSAMDILKPYVANVYIEDGYVICQFKKMALDPAINDLQKNGIEIIKIREYINASEQMYQTLFSK